MDEAAKFEKTLQSSLKLAIGGIVDEKRNELYFGYTRAFITGKLDNLSNAILLSFAESKLGRQGPGSDRATREKVSDLRYPYEWFPSARALPRQIHLHVGPTNSGKTYQALKRLEQAKSGMYAGPLRLLAHEVYTRMNAKGKPCALLTGEEQRFPETMQNYMSSCTVEMMPLHTHVDVAVIDEIQMIGDVDRGWAWTNAFLGVQANEVHLCGEEKTVEVITALCKTIGDKLTVHRYERLSPLEVQKDSINNNFNRLEKGDAIVLFSRMAIHAMKKQVENATGRRCAMVYGSLPPETRAQQAALFNDPDNDYDYLVASDAIGMGLNLSIRRVIFESVAKFDGVTHRQLEVSSLKQIGGRAGRYKTTRDAIEDDAQSKLPPAEQGPKKPTNMGLVTSLYHADHLIVKHAMQSEPEPIKACSIIPPDHVIDKFAAYFPAETPLSYILLLLQSISLLNSLFSIGSLRERLQNADVVHPLKLTMADRIQLLGAPTNMRDPEAHSQLFELATCIAENTNGHLLDLKTFNLGLIAQNPMEYPGGSAAYLRVAEPLHKALTLYLWLSYRFKGVFISQDLAFHTKGLLEKRIDECLDVVDAKYLENRQRKREALEKKAANKERKRAQKEDKKKEANEERGTERHAEALKFVQAWQRGEVPPLLQELKDNNIEIPQLSRRQFRQASPVETLETIEKLLPRKEVMDGTADVEVEADLPDVQMILDAKQVDEGLAIIEEIPVEDPIPSPVSESEAEADVQAITQADEGAAIIGEIPVEDAIPQQKSEKAQI